MWDAPTDLIRHNCGRFWQVVNQDSFCACFNPANNWKLAFEKNADFLRKTQIDEQVSSSEFEKMRALRLVTLAESVKPEETSDAMGQWKASKKIVRNPAHFRSMIAHLNKLKEGLNVFVLIPLWP